jgi:hypothetical protein
MGSEARFPIAQRETPGRDPGRGFSEDMKAPRLGRQTRGKRAWRNYCGAALTTPVLTNGEAAKKWPSSLEKARKPKDWP